ncbi:hypothetical protein [Nocardia cyriacigeorgica]|uniref:hypothetical protein n=1 Tax=Nocardia cyriacigeorgica TaxID=135487 RepID=UPI002456F048|nr:hypothetical protein [Nocardia cyriacigeorgica]
MNPHINRKPAILPRPHPADNIPDKPGTPPVPSTAETPAAEERLIEQHNVRIRPSTKDRLGRAVDKLRYETGDRSISIASLTDQALREFLDRNGC